MKKFLITATGVIALAFLLTINLNLRNEKLQIKMDERVEATDGYTMRTHSCGGGHTYERCDPIGGSCDVHAQTLCPNPN